MDKKYISTIQLKSLYIRISGIFRRIFFRPIHSMSRAVKTKIKLILRKLLNVRKALKRCS